MTEKKSVKETRQTANAMTIGLSAAICLAICLYGGLMIDRHFGTHPAGILGGILLGLASGIIQTIKQLRQIHEYIERKKRSEESENDK